MSLAEILLACPATNPDCVDTSSTSALLVLFPVALFLALSFAWLLSTLVPRHRFVGGALGSIGAVAYLVFANNVTGAFVAWLATVVGGAFVMSRRGRTPPPSGH